MLAAGSSDRRRRLPSFRESFLGADALRVGERLLEAADAAVEEGVVRYGDRLLPVLARRSDAVEGAVDAGFPRVGQSPLSAGNDAGWEAELAAAELARLGPGAALEGSPPGRRATIASDPGLPPKQLHLAGVGAGPGVRPPSQARSQAGATTLGHSRILWACGP